jgi:hypothetical protein
MPTLPHPTSTIRIALYSQFPTPPVIYYLHGFVNVGPLSDRYQIHIKPPQGNISLYDDCEFINVG